MTKMRERVGEEILNPNSPVMQMLRLNVQVPNATQAQIIQAYVKFLNSPAGRDAMRRLYTRQMVAAENKKMANYVVRGPAPQVGQKFIYDNNIDARHPQGHIIKIVNTTAADYMTPEQRRIQAAARREAKLARDTVIKKYLETEAERKQFAKILREYAYTVSKAFMIYDAKSGKEMLALLAGAKAQADAVVVSVLEQELKQRLHEINQWETYMAAMNIVQSQRVHLFINDIGLLQASNQMQKILQAVSWQTAQKLPEIIYSSLVEAFTEAAAGLQTSNAFPAAYLTLIYEVIDKALASGALIQWGTLANNWEMVVDFEKIFGGRVELTQGYHYGAMEATSLGGESALNPRVRLPFAGQDLKNPTNIRYAFFSAIWMGKTFYSPYGTTTRKQHYAAGAKQLKSLNTRAEYLQNKISTASSKRTKLYSGYMTYSQRSEAATQGANLTNEINIAQLDLGYVQKGQAYTKKHLYSEPRQTNQAGFGPAAIKNSIQLVNATINARVNFWRSIGKAPVWLLLEFGQVRYQPIIPPRGVYFRFITKVQKQIKEVIRQQQNTDLSQYYGYTVSPTGIKTVTPQTDETMVEYWLGGKPLKPGQTIPQSKDFQIMDKVIQKFNSTASNVSREIQKAAALGANPVPAQALVDQAVADLATEASSGKWGTAGQDAYSKVGYMPTPASFIGPPSRYATTTPITEEGMFSDIHYGGGVSRSNVAGGGGGSSGGSGVRPTFTSAQRTAYNNTPTNFQPSYLRRIMRQRKVGL